MYSGQMSALRSGVAAAISRAQPKLGRPDCLPSKTFSMGFLEFASSEKLKLNNYANNAKLIYLMN